MARPKKNNADYYSHDADMRNDPKVKALRRKYKHMGYAVWNYLLEVMTDSDYFQVEWSDLNIELLAGDFDVEPENLREIVDYCKLIGLLQVEEGVLSCEKLKSRFKALLSKRNPKSDEFPNQKPAKCEVSDAENPQSKVKESKVNKNKEKESECVETHPLARSPDFIEFENFISSYAPRVAEMQEPFREQEFRWLVKDFKAPFIRKILGEMHNSASLSKNVNAYITFKKFAATAQRHNR